MGDEEEKRRRGEKKKKMRNVNKTVARRDQISEREGAWFSAKPYNFFKMEGATRQNI
jgi:hypothetical protein